MNTILYDTYEELKKFADCNGKYISDSEIAQLLSYLKEKEYRNEKLLRVSMVGRVNAGKSSLTNALVGKAIAPVERRELTSWNTIFWPSDSEYCIITDENSGRMEEISVEDYINIMNSKESRATFLEKKKDFDIFFQSEDVSFAILDIPGFITENKQNEYMAFDEVRRVDLALLLVPGDSSVSAEEMALYKVLKTRNIPVEIIITKSDKRSEEEIVQLKKEIQRIFQTEQDIMNISANACMKAEASALLDRKKIVERINEYQVNVKAERRKNSLRFESECINKLKILQEKLLNDIEKKVYEQYKGQLALHLKSEKLKQTVREDTKRKIQGTYCSQYKEQLISRMTALSLHECSTQIQSIIKEVVPEDYIITYWKDIVDNICNMSEQIWEEELGQAVELIKYLDIIKNDIRKIRSFKGESQNGGKFVGGMEAAAGIGTAVSFYQAVLGPAAEYISMLGAMTNIGLPIAAIGLAVSVAISAFSNNGKTQLSGAEAEKMLNVALSDSADKVIHNLLDILEQMNIEGIEVESKKQEERFIESLPAEYEGNVDKIIASLEQLGTVLFNRQLELKSEIDFYLTLSTEDMVKIEYVDPVEKVVDEFRNQLNCIKGVAYIDTVSRIPFMPVVFLSDDDREHVFRKFTELCVNPAAFKEKIKNTEFEYEYVYKDKVCAIYFVHRPDKKEIRLEYLEVFAREQDRVMRFADKIREGSILSDCQMRRKIISDISSATKSVEILVPWMKWGIKSRCYLYENSMLEAIGQALQNGAKVIIGCGNSEERDKADELASKEVKEELVKNFAEFVDSGKLVFYMESFTHEKFLVVDNRIGMCGSYNFLSNSGKFEDRTQGKKVKQNKNNFSKDRNASESEYPGESMKLTENIESIQAILERMRKKYK
ncbi:MAG: GTP-binding protein [Lachnospiraceae bacterium]|nr:GTP-binding protein [Lachnospiraceae bacterium]